ncbi:MAG: hypothetical protein DI539_15720 [Flavobacterium psychrophilum]|nr:MAG: hypothetical protein DI539_15720 [Flavobacterium psychrophilum]
MVQMKYISWMAILLAVAYLIWTIFGDGWKSQVMPGELSTAHAQLASDCASCHTSVKGISDTKCVSCHSDNKELLQRQPTAFHGLIGNCASCHTEHQGANANLRVMNHEAMAKIGSNLTMDVKNNSEQLSQLDMPADHPLISALEAKLDCASCHSTKDKHVGLFGQNCASCHATTQWTIPKFQHPSPKSIQCASCHQAPPSHYMMHFEMVDKTVVSQGEAGLTGCCGNVQDNQCYTCHQTTSFNDIKGVGYYKHH